MDIAKSERTLAWIWLVLDVVAASTAASLFRLAALPALEAAGLRLLLSGLVLLPFGALGLRRLGRQEGGAILLASLALAVHFGAWVESLYLTSVASSVVLVSASPLFVLLWELLGRERVSRGQWFGAAIGLAGVVVISFADSHGQRGALTGDLLALLGAFAFSVYLRAGRKARRNLPVLSYVAPVYAIAGAGLLLLQPLVGHVLWPLGPSAWLMTALLVLGPTLIGHTGFNFALRAVPASSVAMASLLEPLAAVLIAWPLLHSLPRASDVAGGAMTVIGMMIFVLARAASSSGALGRL